MAIGDSFSGNAPPDAFASIAAQVRGERKWYQIDWRELMEWKTLYICTACLSFVLLALFGAVSMVVTNDCIVDQPGGRCCECLHFDPSRLVGQTMQYTNNYNSVFYGIVMIVNSGFGFYYVIVGVRSENKYQLFCMLVTQLLEVLRALTDTWLESNPALQGRAVARAVLAYMALALLIVSALVVRPLYKQFGWNIFRKGGVLKPVREMYKIYQGFRAFNRLDVQSSALLFLIFGLYLEFVQGARWWVWATLLVCDILASRWMVKYLKQENPIGFYCSCAAKVYVIIWWCIICAEYMACRSEYADSLVRSEAFWNMNPYPDITSIRDSYNGRGCLASHTSHDDRTMELIFLNLAQALFFRLGSLVIGVLVARRFGGGLKSIFYKAAAAQQALDEAGKAPEGGEAVKFVPKSKSKKNQQFQMRPDASDTELASRTDAADADVPAASNYSEYEDDGADQAGGRQDAMEEDGLSQKEIQDDLAW